MKESLPKRIILIISLLIMACVGELAILHFSLHTFSAVRALIEGESLWSKAQKNAVIELGTYFKTHHEEDYQAFLKALSIPEGDQKTKAQLQLAHPDYAVIRDGFLQGHHHPDDIAPLTQLLRRFYWVSYLSDAIRMWDQGDQFMLKLRSTAAEYHRLQISSGDVKKASELEQKIFSLNHDFTDLEERFSKNLGEGSRALVNLLLLICSFFIFCLIGTTIILLYFFNRSLFSVLDSAELSEQRSETIEKMALENAKLKEESKAAVEMREDFMSIASHELKTPLTALQIQLQILYRVLNDPRREVSLEQAKALSEGGLQQSRRLNILIDELMDLTRINAGKLELHPKPCNLSEIVAEHVLALHENAILKGSAITLHSQGPINGYFDSSRVGQIVTNLVSNAIKYGNGSPIEVNVDTKNDRAVIEVKDHGPGIELEKQKRIFKRFERATQDSHISGLGLGLYICKEITQAHHGNISVHSGLGKGSTFTVDLPIERA